MTQRRRSLLQSQILIALGARPVTSISELAERIDAKRPSVSRSLKLLIEADLVTQPTLTSPAASRQWSLTEAGREEAAIAETRLAEEAVRSIKSASRKYVTIRDKDGTARRLVASNDEGATVHFKDAMWALSATSSAMDVFREIAGAQALMMNTIAPPVDLGSIIGRLGLVDERLLNPLASIADEYQDRVLDTMASLGTNVAALAYSGLADTADTLLTVPNEIMRQWSEIGEDYLASAKTLALGEFAYSVAARVDDHMTPPDRLADILAGAIGGERIVDSIRDAVGVTPFDSAAMFPLGSGLSDLLTHSLALDTSTILGPIAATQNLYAESLGAMVSSWSESALASDAVRLAAAGPSFMLDGIAADIIGIQRAELTALEQRNQTALGTVAWVGDALEEASIGLQGSFADRLDGMTFAEFNAIVAGTDHYRDLIGTTAPLAHLASGMRHYVEAEVVEDWTVEPVDSEPVDMGHTDLDPLLARIHPDLPGMRRSTWQTLANDAVEDRLSQATLSMRRLVALMLDELVPAPEGEEMTIRDRLNRLMPGHKDDAKMAAAVLDAFGIFGGRINMVVHIPTIYRHERSCREMLHAVEHILGFILCYGGTVDRLNA